MDRMQQEPWKKKCSYLEKQLLSIIKWSLLEIFPQMLSRSQILSGNDSHSSSFVVQVFSLLLRCGWLLNFNSFDSTPVLDDPYHEPAARTFRTLPVLYFNECT